MSEPQRGQTPAPHHSADPVPPDNTGSSLAPADRGGADNADHLGPLLRRATADAPAGPVADWLRAMMGAEEYGGEG